ncbi:uncharacterized protein Dwil_GK27514 [Drosophila willistoni]|uniref:CHHC U11-48K-type domain-containing protein n=1 Tax=Drosophila willistoni TaxID=7260 RepID=A0A0Q9WRI3_DROWI|nr:gametocyte-specific factor 1 homolog [Drosophila willistoni]KRF98868.1 uncharacterized protein Dwil_GK27514 [Drosophila willistoni]
MSSKADLHTSIINSSDWTHKCVTCPFDKTHRLMPNRLATHLYRCARNYSGVEMKRCPFDISHVVSVADMQDHVLSCVYRSSFERFQCPDKMPIKPNTGLIMQIIETTEDWDKEPEVPSYDPSVYCANNPVVRTLHGVSAATRRNFREFERKRFRSFPKKRETVEQTTDFIEDNIFSINEEYEE